MVIWQNRFSASNYNLNFRSYRIAIAIERNNLSRFKLDIVTHTQTVGKIIFRKLQHFNGMRPSYCVHRWYINIADRKFSQKVSIALTTGIYSSKLFKHHPNLKRNNTKIVRSCDNLVSRVFSAFKIAAREEPGK